MRRSGACLFVVLTITIGSLGVLPSAARADDASALIERGLDLRQARKDAEALALFEAAQRLAPSPRGQAQVALAQQALGRWAAAERNLKAALAAKDDAWVQSRRPVLEQALAVIGTHLGDVELVGGKGAVFVDGARMEEPDALTHLRLEVGQRIVELRADGMYPFSRRLDVLPGESLRIEVDQHPLLKAPSEPLPPPVEPKVTPPPAPSEPGHTQRVVGWASLGAAGAFLAIGVGGLVERSSAASDFNASAACTSTTANALSGQCRSWMDEGNTGSTVAIVGFVGSGVLTALSIALLVTAPSASPKRSSFALPCVPEPRGIACSLSF
jgi:hypothetical protein